LKYQTPLLFILLLTQLFLPASVLSSDNRTPLAPETSPEVTQTAADKLWGLIQNIYQKLQAETDIDNNSTINQLLTQGCGERHPDQTLAMALKQEAEQQSSNYGLSLRGGYTSDNLQENSGDPDAYLELSWDLWRQGYAENQRRARSLKQQAAISQLHAKMAQQKLDGQCRDNTIGQSFIGQLNYLLTLKLALMEPVHQIERRAYFKNWSYLDDLLVSDQDLRLLRQELRYLNSSPYLDNELNNRRSLPVIDLDINRIIKTIREDNQQQNLQQLEKQALIDRLNVTDDDQLRLFVRQQFDVGNTNDSGVVAGVRFSIPFEKRKQVAKRYRLAHLEQQTKLQAWQRITKTRAAYQSLQEQHQRTIKQYYRFLQANERLRRSMVQKNLNNDLKIASAVSRLRSVLDTNIELVRANQELYRRANQVFITAALNFNPAFINVSNLQQKDYRLRKGERSIYLWSKGFNNFDNTFIFSFLKTKGIQRVLLTAGRVVNKNKMSRFIRDAGKQGIMVESIIGPNSLFFSNNHDAAAIAVERAATLSDAVHLDIEPHTFPEYKKNKPAYLQQYIGMLQNIRATSPDIKLTIAVPFHWPEHVYAAISTLVDRVYVMAYGSTKIKTIIRRLQPALSNIDKHKVIPVLRVTDFKDEWQLEQVIEALQQQTGLQRYSLHTFRRFVQKVGR